MPRLRALLKSPPLAKGDAEQQLEELRDYLLQIVEELGYLLTHIEADNINDTTFERISQMIPKAFTGTPTMDGEGSPGTAPTWARGDHTHPKDSSKADVTALAAHIADRLNPHAVTKAQVGLGNVADERQYSAQNPPPVPSAEDVGAIPATEKGSAGGVAELDANGMVPSAQLPSYVDDVLEYASLSVFPVTGESGKIYVALDTNKTYRWSGSAYTEISESLALGETSSTAYRGDRGKAAYDHSQLTSGNPHNVTAAEAGAVPTSREVNGHALSSDITLDAADVGARADTWMPSASDVGAQSAITANGILKGDGAGGVSAAVAGADYQAPLTAGTDYATPVQLDGKANQSQLAYVETGTTASRNYTAGQYISLNGLLYTADTAIASGATFYTSGGNKNLTECVGGGFNSLSNVANANVTFGNNITGYTYQNEYHLSKSGNVVAANIYMSASSIAGMGTVLCTVPAAFRPSVNRRIATWLTYNGEAKVETVFLSPTGEITTASGGSTVTGWIRVFGMYML